MYEDLRTSYRCIFEAQERRRICGRPDHSDELIVVSHGAACNGCAAHTLLR
jgi:hypothetical protein